MCRRRIDKSRRRDWLSCRSRRDRSRGWISDRLSSERRSGRGGQPRRVCQAGKCGQEAYVVILARSGWRGCGWLGCNKPAEIRHEVFEWRLVERYSSGSILRQWKAPGGEAMRTMHIEIRDEALAARIQKQIHATGSASAEEALL